MKRRPKILLLDVAGLSYSCVHTHALEPFWNDLNIKPAQTVFPAVTCPVQATLRTALPPEAHGLFFNGVFHRDLNKALFWEQSSALFKGKRLFENFRKKGGTVGQLCVQQSMGPDMDFVLTPQPIHKHHGGMIMDCYTQPAGLYPRLCGAVGKKFDLMRYWGPLSSAASSDWIAKAAAEILKDAALAPDLFYVYLPHLDYDQQKFGPADAHAVRAFHVLEKTMLAPLIAAARAQGYEILLCGDYAITEVDHAVFPNRLLREAGLLKMREVGGMMYPDIWASDAFAMVDHQTAQIVVFNPKKQTEIRACLTADPGIEILPAPHSPFWAEHDLLIQSAPDAWFAYPWWKPGERGPDYASHIDIHNKPGFDPCELFFKSWYQPFAITQDTRRIRGSHGRIGPGREIPLGGTLPLESANTLLDWTCALKQTLDDAL